MKKTLQWILILTASFLSITRCKSKSEGSETETIDSTSNAAPVSVAHLSSWNDGDTKTAITDYVRKVTAQGDAAFIPVEDRIAVFDNDGTLWAEQPLYFQMIFAFDRIRQIAPEHPEWKNKEPFKSLLAGDMKKVFAQGEMALIGIMNASSAGMTGAEFTTIVQQWMDTARHPISKKPYTSMVYQPMLELLQYLRENQFKTFIVSGGDIDFMRAWTEKTYGIPNYQVVGSSLKAQYGLNKDSVPSINRLAQFDFLDDGPGKPVGIYRHIGQRPVFAAGNSDGDYQMLQWTTTGTGTRLAIIVHHTDSVREWKYDRNSPIGKLDKGLTDAPKYGWKLVDMKNDWKVIFPK
ncbi:HAD family hydrolase [Pollutibacter soli]|uniref:HAD family hydrolase n=1 Tax=Pollutibacter soli TaxID=3034157 RepID=UPI0030132AC2